MTTEPPVADWVTISDLFEDPFPIFKRLRAEGGVHWAPNVNRYLITSYEAVHGTELDQQTFSANEEGSLQIRAMGHSMLRRDDPEHYIERKAWQPALRPGAVKRIWAQKFDAIAEKYLAEMIAKGPGADLIWDFSAPFAAESLRQILGLYSATQEDLQRWSQTMINATGNYADDPEVWALGKRSFDEVDSCLDEMLQWHAAHPDDSVLSRLLAIPDYQMPIERIRANIKMSIGGGLNEPRDALGVAAWALLTHPEQRAAAQADPSLWHTVFDEGLRWVAPIGMYSRQTTREVELAGATLPAGAKLGICPISANRDSSVWEDAESFDIHREAKPHLSFSKGVHVCLGAWVARSEVADIALPKLFGRLQGLDLIPEQPATIGGWVFRGMLSMPVTWDRALTPGEAGVTEGREDGRLRPSGSVAAASSAVVSPAAARASEPGAGEAEAAPAARPSIAVVGSGPSGSFTAQALRRTFPQAPIDVFDKQPTPYGLVRYGVATDHQGTKAVSRQFDRLFLRESVKFRGNVALGTDVRLDELRENYDVVVLATGMHGDAALPIPGGTLARGAGEVTRHLNGHPEQAASSPLGKTVAIVGMGNVAMDLTRLLAVDATGLEGSDACDATHHALTENVRTIHVVGRSAVPNAKFDPAMVRELASLPGVQHVVHGDVDLGIADRDARTGAVRELMETAPTIDDADSRITIEWWFGWSPRAIAADAHGRVTGLNITGPSATGLSVTGPNVAEPNATTAGAQRASEEGNVSTQPATATLPGGRGRPSSRPSVTSIPCDDVITAVGFAQNPDSPVPAGQHHSGRVEPGLYAAGWLRRGPRGTIPDQRTDSRGLAQAIADDVRTGAAAVAADRTGIGPIEGETDFDGWRRIDLKERLAGAPGRERAKLATTAELLAAARDVSFPLPPAESGAHDALRVDGPVTIAFATESGGAELVAEDLRGLLGDGADVVMSDLGDLDPAALETDRFHIIVSATYGDGEVPTSARPFHHTLVENRPDLAGLRYAVFGMGDKTYTRTYSRGSELIDEALTAAGAQRVGEYGRHDAAGPVGAQDAARDWVEGVLAELAEQTRRMQDSTATV